MKISCTENKVDPKENVKYLGVSLDQTLGGRYMAVIIKKKEIPNYGDRQTT